MENEAALPQNRWYDAIPYVGRSIVEMKDLPANVQEMIGRHLNYRIDTYLSQRNTGSDLRSLGVSKALGLYNASNRQRWHDRSSTLYRGLMMLALLPEREVMELGARVLHITTLIKRESEKAKKKEPELVTINKSRLGRSLSPLQEPAPFHLIREVEIILKSPEKPILIQRAGILQLGTELEQYSFGG